jgi:hypothetical protein
MKVLVNSTTIHYTKKGPKNMGYFFIIIAFILSFIWFMFVSGAFNDLIKRQIEINKSRRVWKDRENDK